MKQKIIVALIMLGANALSYGIVVGFVKLITLCFGLRFSILIATGVWLSLWIVFRSNKNN